MTSSRAQVAPVNLKERIAALQQRNVSPPPRPTSPSPGPAPNSAGLRDKIARFEKKGGIPVPRGSFGLGAPPLAENAPQKRRGELYGNRIPGAARVTSGGPPISRPTSPLESPRSFSLSAVDAIGDDNGALRPSSPTPTPTPSSPVSPFPSLSVDHADGKDLTPRATPFSAVLDEAETGDKTDKKPDTVESASSVPLSAEKEDADDNSAGHMPQPPIAIVVSSEEDASSHQGTIIPEEPAAEKQTSVVPVMTSQLQKPDSVQTTPEVSIQPPLHIQPPECEQAIPTEESATTKDDTNAKIPEPSPASVKSEGISTTTQASEISNQGRTEAPVEPAPSSDRVRPPVEKSTNLEVEVNSPDLPPAGPFTLANAAYDLGKLVANIQDMFPGQMSPIVTPPASQPLRAPESSDAKNVSCQANSTVSGTTKGLNPDSQKGAKSTPSIDKKVEKGSVKAQPLVTDEPLKAAGPRTISSNQTSLSSTHARPVTMFETSSQGLTPHTSPPSFLPVASRQLSQQHYEHFPPTPEHNETTFGTVNVHKPSHSYSTDNRPKSTFSAVVHKKVTEIPRLQPSAFYETPQANKTGAPMLGEVLLSPGFGELTALLKDAALLERSLESGQLQDEEEVAKQKRAEEQRAADEKMKNNETASKANTKRESADGKSKSRNPTLRSKTWRKDGSGEVQANPARSKSVFLSFRPGGHDTSTTRQSLHAPLPENQVAGLDVDNQSQKSAQKSPRQYFASLRRLTSSSRSSTPSVGHSRHSVSTSSEMSSEDSASLPTPPGATGIDSSDSGHTELGYLGGVSWPSLSPKKASSTMSRAASFADKMWGRSRTRSTVSSTSAYGSVDRLANPAATKSAVTLLPQLESLSYQIDIPDLPSPPAHLVSPGRSGSVYSAPNTPFPPLYSAQPTSPVYTATLPTTEESLSIDAVFAANLTNAVYMPATPQALGSRAGGGGREGFLKPLDEGLFSAKPTSPVYTPVPGFRLDEAGNSHPFSPPLPSPMMPSPESPSAMSFLSTPGVDRSFRDSWISGDSSMDASVISLNPALVDSFPSVPSADVGTGGNHSRPTLPLSLSDATGGSFFEAAPPLSSMAIGAEFLPARSATLRSAPASRVSGEHRR